MTTSDAQRALWAPALDAYNAAFPEGAKDAYGYQYFLTPEDFKTDATGELIIGYAGSDGIEFRLRADSIGVWAYYPSEGRYQLLGPEIVECVNGWVNGTIAV